MPAIKAALVATLAAGCSQIDTGSSEDLAASEAAWPGAFLGTLADIDLLPEPLPEDGGAYAHTLSMPPGTRLWRVPVPAGLADSACVDHSDPVFYVRAAPVGSAHGDDWILFVPGGGSVATVDDAVETWFGEGRAASYGEMSSRWAPPSIGTQGILNPNSADNPFADFNMVFIHKCSYDRYMGRREGAIRPMLEDHSISGYFPGAQFPVGITLSALDEIEFSFRGHDIVDAVIDGLADHSVSYDDGSGVTTMPSLAAARTVLFIGHSGGARGATMIIDDVADHIRGWAPSADVRLVVDGAFEPSATSLVNGATYPATSYPTFDPANGGDPLASAAAFQVRNESQWEADGDATCNDNEADDAVCGDFLHVLMNWVETPFYVRQDLADQNHATGKNVAGDDVHDCWQTSWDTNPDLCYGDTFAHGGGVLDQVEDLALLRTQALTHTVLGTTLAPPSGFFPACGFHDGAHTFDGFYSTLHTPFGLRRSYAELLWQWYAFPNIPFRAVEGTVPTSIPTACPP